MKLTYIWSPALLAAVVLWLGCGATGPLEVVGPEGCRSDAECKGERICHEGSCVFPEDVWVDPEEPEPLGEVGDPCAARSDCLPGYSCFKDFPGGYCIVDCGDECPEGSHCVTGESWTVCMKTCEEHADCREEYACYSDGGSGRACLPRHGGGHVDVGGPCTSAADCGGERAVCWTTWPGGYCVSYDCHLHGCPEGSSCHVVGEHHICYADCDVSDDCGRDEYVCWSLGVDDMCLPHCGLVDLCYEHEECNEESGQCE